MTEVVLTGRFNLGEKFIKRDKLIELASRKGITIASKVTHHTDYLVTTYHEDGEMRGIQGGHVSQKQRDALALGTTIMKGEAFAAWLLS